MIAALVGVVVLVAGVIVWRFFGDALSNRSDTAADRCLGGEAKVAVLADPAIADNISAFAKKFNASAGPVGDKCVSVDVTPADSDGVVDGLEGTWPEALGNKPTLWIPGSSVASARLQAAAGPKVVGSARSLATSPVLLAVRPELKSALDQQSWATLSNLQTDQAALDGLDLAGWGSLRLALPKSGDSDASYLAAEAVASASAPQGSPVTAGIGCGQRAGRRSAEAGWELARRRHEGPARQQRPGRGAGARRGHHRAAALPPTRQDCRTPRTRWPGGLPPGPVAVADFPAVLLTGDWIAEEQASAASEFERFLHKPEQLAELAKAGFRTEGNTPPGNDVTAFAPLAATLSIGDDSARVAVANALSAPVPRGQTTSIMLDRSLNLGPVVSALNARIAALPPTSAVGLTTFDGGQSTTQVNVGALGDPVDGQTRSAAITSTAQRSQFGRRRRRGVVHHASQCLCRGPDRFPSGPAQFGARDHLGPTHRSVAGLRRSAGSDPVECRPGPSGRGECHQRRR